MNSRSKKAVLLIGVILVGIFTSLILTNAIPLNWFNTGSTTGKITPTLDVQVTDIPLDLGTLKSAQEFSVSGVGTIYIGMEKGINITKFLMTPHLYYPEPKVQSTYWLSRFIDLTVNYTIDGNVFSMPIIINNKLMAGTIIGEDQIPHTYWIDQLAETSDRSLPGAEYCFYQPWEKYHLTKGTHTTALYVYGLTNLVSADTPVDIHFTIELSLL